MGARFLTTALLCCLFLSGPALCSAQWWQQPISAKYNQEPLSKVLQKNAKELGVTFAFDAGKLRTLKVTANIENEPAGEALTKLLASVGYRWSEASGVVIIVPLPIVENTPPIQAQLMVQISGTVCDAATGESLPFALLHIAGSNIHAETDANGSFFIKDIPSDTCRLTVNYVGYSEFTSTISKLGKPSIRIAMEQARTFLPSAVIEDVITPQIASRPEDGTIVMNPAGIDAASGTGEPDVLKAPQLLPGISGTAESSAGLFIRGSNSDQGLLTYDGFTLYHLDHFFGLFSALNVQSVKSLSVHKGHADASFGGRIGGVIEVVGKDGNNVRPKFHLHAGPLAIGLAFDSPLNTSGTSTVALAYRRSLTDFVFGNTFRSLFNTVYNAGLNTTDSQPSDGFNSGYSPSYYFQDFTGKFTLRWRSKYTFKTSVFLSGDRLNFTYLDPAFQNRYALLSNNASDWGNRGVSTRCDKRLNERDRWSTTVALSRYTSSFYNGDSLTDLLFQQTTAQYRNDRMVLRDFTARSEWSRKRLMGADKAGFVLNSLHISSEKRLTGNTITEQAYTSVQKGSVLTAYGSKSYRFGRWNGDAGARLNYYTIDQRWYPEWRVGASRDLSETWKVFGAIDRHVQFVQRIYAQSIFNSTSDLWYLSGDREVPVLLSDQGQVGLHRSGKRWDIEALLYAKINRGTFEYLGPYQGALNIDNVPNAPSSFIARGNGRSYGADVMVHYHFGRWNTWWSYSWLNAWNKLEGIDQRYVPMFTDQRHELKWYAEYRQGFWQASSTVIYGTGRPFTALAGQYPLSLADGTTKWMPVYGPLNGARLADYRRWDVSLSRRFERGWGDCKIQVAVQNVLDTRNVRELRYTAQYATSVSRREVFMLPRVVSLQIEIDL